MSCVVCGSPATRVQVEVAPGVEAHLCATDAAWAPMLFRPETLAALKAAGEPARNPDGPPPVL